ncbi:hypothetical protein [Nostoc sp.]
MCDTPEQLSRLDRLEALAIRNTEAIANVTVTVNHKVLKTNVKIGVSAIVNQSANSISNRAIAPR